MSVIDCYLLEKVVYNLCLQAGQNLPKYTYEKIFEGYKKNNSQKLARILQNAQKARKTQRPLCQDTGTVHVFLEIGHEISFSSNPEIAINEAVKRCYIENYFRKSTVENEFISGKNRETNTPALINTRYVDGNSLKVMVLLKGAGCDNVSVTEMLLPSITEDEFAQWAAEKILEKGQNACPPLFISVAAGTGAESVMEVAEKAFFTGGDDLPQLCDKILQKIYEKTDPKYEKFYIADLKLTVKPHHMASLPVAIAFNCHSLRIASALISKDKVEYDEKLQEFANIKLRQNSAKKVDINNISELKNLKEGEEVLLSGEILIARDAAHKKMLNMKKNGQKLPFDLENKTIFYAAPCPSKPYEVVGSIGATTASRMDKFLPEFPEIAATIGKGSRSEAAKDFIKKNNSVYFETEGGIATLMASCFENFEVIAFEELSTEAVCRAKIKDFPAKVAVASLK